MRIPYEATVGDLIDKLSILFIKLEKIESSDSRVKLLEEEKQYIVNSLESNNIFYEKLNQWTNILETNRKLWDHESNIRKNPEVTQHSKGIYLNDIRHLIKNKINSEYKSTLEVKLHDLSHYPMDN